jgi:hypothetical protein
MGGNAIVQRMAAHRPRAQTKPILVTIGTNLASHLLNVQDAAEQHLMATGTHFEVRRLPIQPTIADTNERAVLCMSRLDPS